MVFQNDISGNKHHMTHSQEGKKKKKKKTLLWIVDVLTGLKIVTA